MISRSFACWLAAAGLVSAAGCRHAPPVLVPTPTETVAEIRLEGFDLLTQDDIEDLRDRLPLRRGSALTGEAEEAAARAAIERLQNRGRPYARVAVERQPMGENRVRLILRADPGTLGFFGPIEIVGNRSIDDAIIRRRLAYAPGDLFSRIAIERSQLRIGALDLFKSVEIRAQDVDARPAEVPTVVTVEERTPWRWRLSLGYAAGERLGVDAGLSHLNVLGAARRLDLDGHVSRIDRVASALFTQTDTWHPSLSFSLEAQARNLDQPAFDSRSRGGQAAVTWRWSPQLATTLSYASAFECSRVDADVGLLSGRRNGMLNAWAIDLDHRAPGMDADVPPERILRLHVEQAGGWMPGTFHYYNLLGDARRYRAAFDARLVLAGRFRYGFISPMGREADVPVLKRFFQGGPEEMRGWGRYEVSPLSETGAAVGGRSLFSAAGEARFPIFSRFRGVVFVEAGNVWRDVRSFDVADLLYDAGPGLRIDTPFGLLRVDVGYQLKRLDALRIDGAPQKHRWRLNVGLGEAF